MLLGRLRGVAIAIAAAVAACSAPVAPPRPQPAPPVEASPPVADLHVDLAVAIAREGRALHDVDAAASVDRLRRGRVALLVLPLFVPDADSLPPAEVRRDYEETFTALLGALKSS